MIEINGISALLKAVVDENLIQSEDGSFPAGHNGPHGDIETPVRTTSHALYMLCWLVDNGFYEYKEKANRAVDYLLSKQARPMSASFWCRKNPEKDFNNGLVGQAWVFEALLKAHEVLKRDDCYQIVEEVFLLHKWADDFSVWHSLNVDGSYNKINNTFNQQLWFSYIGLSLKSEVAQERATSFICNVLPYIEIYKDGTVFHDTLVIGERLKLNSSIRNNLIRVRHFIQKRTLLKEQRLRSVGYHGFNLIPMLYIRKLMPDLEFWKTIKFSKIVSVLNGKTFLEDMSANKYSFPYNPIGFEMAKLFELSNDFVSAKKLIKMQLEYITITNDRIAIAETEDVNNSLARLYEVCRIDLDRISG